MADPSSVEVLKTGGESRFGRALLEASIEALKAAGWSVRVTTTYSGRDPWLWLYGGGERTRVLARRRHRRRGNVVIWDLGYFGRDDDPARSYGRLSVNDDHPWRFLDRTSNDPARWDALGIDLREDADPQGPVVVIGMGQKSRKQLGIWDWEDKTLLESKLRFPDRKVIYRPKRREYRHGVEHVPDAPIDEVIKGASLVICRHSNVAIDACIAGIPVECEDGAAYWLYRNGANPSREKRLDFLHRAAHWQYRIDELDQAWALAQAVAKGQKK